MLKTGLIFLITTILTVILISSFTLFQSPQNINTLKAPQDFDKYQKEWASIDDLIKKGLPKSALEETEELYERAKSEKNQPQIVKTLLYRIKLKAAFEEEFVVNLTNKMKQEIETTEAPVKQFLHSITADLYWRYYQANRYKFLDRTALQNPDGEDIRTWDLKRLMKEITFHYNASLTEDETLQSANLKDFDEIILFASGSKKYRPSVYDFLAHRAADFFMHDESSLVKPQKPFNLNNPEFFSDPTSFSKIEIQTEDSLSLTFKAISVFQKLIHFHLKDEDPTALTDVWLKTIKFVHTKSYLPEKDELYLKAIQSWEEELETHPASADIGYAIAQYFDQQGNKYQPLISEDNQWDKKTAVEKCKEVIEAFPETNGAQNCKSLLNQIERKQVSIALDETVPVLEPQPFLLGFKNTDRLFFRLVKMDYDEFEALQKQNRQREELVKKYVLLEATKSWQVELPNEGDFQQHSTELELPATEAGYYLMLAATSAKFDPNNDHIFYTNFWSTNISFISQNNNDGVNRFYVLNRSTGKPIKDVVAEVFYQQYNYRSRETTKQSGGTFTSDANGYFEIPSTGAENSSKSYYLQLQKGNDELVSTDRFYHSGRYTPTDRKTERTFFFTDRAIYRPGQTVYFKGIVLENYKDEYSITANTATTVVFNDVNYQKITELDLTTNEFGSFNGTVVIPDGLLNGNMTLRNGSGSITIQVEEYKRPTFEVSFNPVEGSYRLGEEVAVTGSVKAFAGNVLGGATVNYRVVREVRFPWRYFFYDFYPFPQGDSQEITHGETTAGDDGSFEIAFEAIPDHSVSEKFKPAFNYTIHADVSDITGETHTATTSVQVSYTAMMIEADVPEAVNRATFDSFKLSTKNLNGQKVEAKGSIKIERLKEPDRLLRNRQWNQPDRQILDEKEFVGLFPYDVFQSENQPENFKVETNVFSQEFQSTNDSLIGLTNLKNWKTGRYRLTINSIDAFGEKVELIKHFTVFDINDKRNPVNEISWLKPSKTKCEPGENASFIIGSAASDVQVLYEVVFDNEVIHKEWFKLDDEQSVKSFPVTEELRGGFNINLYFIKHNRSYSESFRVDVPFTNKQLDISFKTFRNKLLPGAKEEWQMIIKDKKGDAIAAELLASMYDASLDQFITKDWSFELYSKIYRNLTWQSSNTFGIDFANLWQPPNLPNPRMYIQYYDQLNWFGFSYYGGIDHIRPMALAESKRMDMPGEAMEAGQMEDDVDKLIVVNDSDGEPEKLEEKNTSAGLQLRRDFRETAFFFSTLKTNENGDVIFSFEMPESLTRWKFRGLAHSKDLKTGMIEKEVVTQKELMVVPNPPRFFREGDQMSFSAKVVNLSDKSLSGTVKLEFIETTTGKIITSDLISGNQEQSFEIETGLSTAAFWKINIPYKPGVISYRIIAETENFSDGEEKPIPILSNRMLVTEAMPLPVNGNQTKDFVFEKLVNSGSSKSLKNHKLSLEFSSNPAWYAVQALPYIMERENESADAAFRRFYANSIASHLVNSKPKIKLVLEVWKNYSPDALLSNLEKNEELKSVILKETPWVLDAKNETERKKRIALLFDLNKMQQEKYSALKKLMDQQSPSGGWPWFKGMRDNRYITQEIVKGMARLQSLGVEDVTEDRQVKIMLNKAIRYLDREMQEDYERLQKNFPEEMSEDHLSQIMIHYLYSRSMFLDEVPLDKKYQTAFSFYRDQSIKHWVKKGLQSKGLIALALNNLGNKSTPTQIMKSVKEHALYNEEMGLYFRDNQGGWFWYKAPIETQAQLIEAFDVISNDQKAVEQMKQWLLKQKQTQDWKTPKATAEAVYALLSRGTDWLESDKLAIIKMGDETIDPTNRDDTQVEAGTGYFKTSWNGKEIKPEMGHVKVTNQNSSIAWGAVYWQYFEDLDKITFAETPLQLKKQLFVEHNTNEGPVLVEVEDGTEIAIGEKIKVRIELRVDRDMEFVHMKDMRASAFEPVNVLSGFRYQGGLGYYESTLDASTNFFFDYLRKGTYVFEYPLMATQMGDFSNGITSIQCSYAPEFTSHSEGVRVIVK